MVGDSGHPRCSQTFRVDAARLNRSIDNEKMTYLVIVAFVAIIGSLAAALVFMMRGHGVATDADETTPRKNHMARALAFRVGFSILLFAVVLVSYLMGWIQPTGVPMQP